MLYSLLVQVSSEIIFHSQKLQLLSLSYSDDFTLALFDLFCCRNQGLSLEVMSMTLIAPCLLKFPCPPYLLIPPRLLAPRPPPSSLLPLRSPFPPFLRKTPPLALPRHHVPLPPCFATRGLPLPSRMRSLPVFPLGNPFRHRLSMILPTAPLPPSLMLLGQHDLLDQNLQWWVYTLCVCVCVCVCK